MRRTLMIAGLVAAVAAPSLASAESCQRYAHDRRVTGTVVGGLGGALIGQAISHNTAGTLIGGVGGAVVGNQVARVHCSEPSRAYYRAPAHHPHANRSYEAANSGAPGGCGYENRAYYDERGQLIYAPTQVCR